MTRPKANGRLLLLGLPRRAGGPGRLQHLPPPGRLPRLAPGLVQLDELLRPKIASSSIAPYVEVQARIEGENEKRLLPVYSL